MLAITGKTMLLGIIGDPVEHSLSPLMQNAAITNIGVDYIYLPFPVLAANLEQALAGFAAVDVVGFNATIPHKQTIISLLSEITPTAQAIGAVNTVWRTKNGWKGTNTDVTGFIAPLQTMNRDWSNSISVVLGNGGAARAVVAGLAELGCSEINIVGRNKDKLAQFGQSWQNSNQIASLLKIHYWENLSGLLPTADLLVNTTPIGMHPKVDASPINQELMQKLKPNAIAYDLIYNPSPTKFLTLAQDRGAKAIDGLEMLVQQGAAALEIWLQQSAPIDIMRRSLQEKLYDKHQ
ncbi:Shikimate dehydrogenase (NADP(+)) [Hyella patelloides LEGE 07179]|uniref:Shikimate dehydrogenase (NADP(+)) n=1 Tax=Hyella patelloides LEGE 07179 TaxID=945734 RepID=A0A563VPQ4_9CYAN|nr:shikimate dehydrogenase [Hyella patelloides]VEP13448.1 Shikimate dehydrogenase (NADP(+)) [Hyella patelloides LEGE 07179]